MFDAWMDCVVSVRRILYLPIIFRHESYLYEMFKIILYVVIYIFNNFTNCG